MPQHIFIPVLPPRLLGYCSAPMPFLLGVHSSMLQRVLDQPLEDVRPHIPVLAARMFFTRAPSMPMLEWRFA